jgi:hypothetical protein
MQGSQRNYSNCLFLETSQSRENVLKNVENDRLAELYLKIVT